MPKRLTEKEIKERLNKNVELITKFTKINEEGTFRCKTCENIWTVKSIANYAPKSKKPYGCPKCAKKRDIERLKGYNKERTFSNEEIQEKLNKKFNGSIIIINYISMRAQNTFKCLDCEYEFMIKGYSIFSNDRHSGCPNCKTGSNGERAVRTILKEKNIVFNEQVTIKGLNGIKGSPLRIDFYLVDYDIYLEYNGRQHYTAVAYDGNEVNAIKKFNDQKANDKIKKDFLKDKLLIIRYDENIEEKLKGVI